MATHPLNLQLTERIEEVENILAGSGTDSSGEPEEISNGEIRGSPRRLAGVASLVEEMTSTPNVTRSLFGTDRNSSLINSPRRTEDRPSPERLDAQVRQLSATHSRRE